MLEDSIVVVTKEPGYKVGDLMAAKMARAMRKHEYKPKKGESEKRARARRSVQGIIRWFAWQGPRRTCSVFTAKNVTEHEMKLMRLVARSGRVTFMAVAETADSGPHAHIVVFRVIDGQPQPLSVAEERAFIDAANLWIAAWRVRKNTSLLPCRFYKLKTVLDEVTDVANVIYKVPKAESRKDERQFASGMQHFAIGYTLKTILNPSKVNQFLCSVGVGEVDALAKKHNQVVRFKRLRLWHAQHTTYKFAPLSYAVLEAAKQLLYLPPEKVCVFIRAGKVRVHTTGKNALVLCKNHYMRVGIELLRRDLVDYTGVSLLRRAVVKVSRELCQDLRNLTYEELRVLAKRHREDITWRAYAKQERRTVKERQCRVSKSTSRSTSRT